MMTGGDAKSNIQAATSAIFRRRHLENTRKAPVRPMVVMNNGLGSIGSLSKDNRRADLQGTNTH